MGTFTGTYLDVQVSLASGTFISILCFVRNDLVGAQTLTDELFPVDGEGAELDSTVVQIDLDLVDDYPASDPRWAESVPDGKKSFVFFLFYCRV